MKNKLVFAPREFSGDVTTHSWDSDGQSVKRYTVPAVDENGTWFDKLVAVAKNGNFTWICKRFSA